MTNITVIGASSGIGLQAVKLGLSRGYNMCAFSRSANLIDIKHPNLKKLSGDALDYEHIKKAITGSDAVIQSLGVPLNIKMLTGPISLFSESTKNIISAMENLTVKRLIAITGFGAGDSQASIHPIQRVGFNMIFGKAYADKNKQEQLIKESDLDWTIVRPGVLSDCFKSNDYKVLVNNKEWRNGIISRYNVADFLIKQVDDDTHVGKAPVIVS